jgi:hypothetical protein
MMEAGVVAGLAYWGYETGGNAAAKILLGVGAPVAGFGLWGALDFRWAGRLAEPLRLVEELAISGVAAGAWYAAGQEELGVSLAVLSGGYHVLVYAIGERLLKPPSAAESRRTAHGRSAEPLAVRRDRLGAVTTITCAGRISAQSRPLLETAVRSCLKLRPAVVRFDLRETSIDADGTTLVLALFDECHRLGVDVESVTPPPERETLSRLGLPLRFRMDDGTIVRTMPGGKVGDTRRSVRRPDPRAPA